jgi:hypothetical protein
MVLQVQFFLRTLLPPPRLDGAPLLGPGSIGGATWLRHDFFDIRTLGYGCILASSRTRRSKEFGKGRKECSCFCSTCHKINIIIVPKQVS